MRTKQENGSCFTLRSLLSWKRSTRRVCLTVLYNPSMPKTGATSQTYTPVAADCSAKYDRNNANLIGSSPDMAYLLPVSIQQHEKKGDNPKARNSPFIPSRMKRCSSSWSKLTNLLRNRGVSGCAQYLQQIYPHTRLSITEPDLDRERCVQPVPPLELAP